MTTNSAVVKLPAYMDITYGDIKNDMSGLMAMDNVFYCKLRTLMQYNKLVDAATKEIKMNQSVLQLGVVFGNELDEVALSAGSYGQVDIVDINPMQVNRTLEKYWNIYPCMKVFRQDAAKLKLKNFYDNVLVFMLLSEVPAATKKKIVDNALKMVKPGGKAIFIDWHNPLYYHPLRYVVRMYNRLYNPFVEPLWDHDIETYSDTNLRRQFVWRKSTYFGRMFQKVVAVRKTDAINSGKTSSSISKEESELFNF